MTEAEYQSELAGLLRELHDNYCNVCDGPVRDGGCNASEHFSHVGARLVLLGAAAGAAGIIPKRG
jgi:hypothetical protein